MEENNIAKSRFKRVCVFCGSSSGKKNCYSDAALELGQELVRIHNFKMSCNFVFFKLCVLNFKHFFGPVRNVQTVLLV
jgi:hypothetical protein